MPDSVAPATPRPIGTLIAIIGTIVAVLISLGTVAYAAGVQGARIDAVEQRALENAEHAEPVAPALAGIEARLDSIDTRLENIETDLRDLREDR